jgi:glycosyltransferase involved in cell wall biosynthesis
MKYPKPTVLVFLAHYLPGYRFGGPVQSIANMVAALGAEFRFRIVTSDRDVGDTAPYPAVLTRRWHPERQAEVLYLPPGDLRLRPLARLLRETPHDLIYLNSFFHPRFTTLPLLAARLGLAPRRPVILAPRGEFSAGALALKSNKKRVFMAAARMAGLHQQVLWQASSEHERADILRQFPAARIELAQNLPRPSANLPPRLPRGPGDPLRAVFLSRISPMKNLDYALALLREVRVPVRFTIHGPKEDLSYWNRCAALIASMPPHVEVVDGGSVHPAQVPETISAHDLFLFPTRGENYGHVIAEALGAGTRLLISDQTPWRDLVDAGVGHDLPLADRQAFLTALESEAKRREDPRVTANATRAYLTQTLRMESALKDNRSLFFSALSPPHRNPA